MDLRDETKLCPVCNAAVFADMGTCFNCMYEFGSNERLEERSVAAASASAVLEGAPELAMLSSADIDEPATDPMPQRLAGRCGEMCQLREFLVQFERFLRDFLVDGEVDV